MKLSFKNLTLQLGAFRLELDVEASGEVVGIFGNSGAGKTTLLEIVAGLRKAATGRIQIDDLVFMDTAARIFLPPERRSVGYVPQDLALFPHLSVEKNLAYGRKSGRASSPAIDPSHVVEVLEIGRFLKRSIAELSGGQRQRVAFARALLSSPRLLLMDEPLSSLDHDLKWKIIPYLQRIRDEFKIPMLYVSHAPDEVVALCDQVMVLRNGACLRVSPPADLFEAGTAMMLKPGIF